MTALENMHDVFIFQSRFRYALLILLESFRNIKTFVARIIDFFDNSNSKVENNFIIGGSVMYDLGERTMANESISFLYNHLLYMQQRVLVEIAQLV
jgi:hypothetical protein